MPSLPHQRCPTLSLERCQVGPSLISLAPACMLWLQSGLAARGFKVTRLNTYDTVPVASIDPELLQRAKQALVVTAASPSTIK